MATNAIKYLSNVGKSIAYSTVDQVKEMNPALTSFASTNAEVLRTTYDAVTHLKQTVKKTKGDFLESDYGKIAVKAKNNLFEDLKTGKFYNRERMEKTDQTTLDNMGEDFDLEFEFLDDNKDDSEMSTNDMMDLVAEKSSNAVGTAVARSAEYIVTANSQMNKSLYEQNKAIFSGIHSDISVMNDNLGKLITYTNGPLQTHIENSTTFYQTTTQLDQERNSILKEMLELQKEYYTVKTPNKSGSRTSISDIIDSEGMLDISALMEHLKKRSKSKSGGMFDLVKSMMEFGAMDSLVASPMQFVTDAIAKKMIPNLLQESMKSFNESLSGLFTSAVAKLNQSGYENPIANFLKELLGFDGSAKKSIDVSNYYKGATPFDGVTKKAITEVIPTYLSKILTAVSGESETRYNYETGKFVSVKSIKNYIRDLESDASLSAGMDIYSDMQDLAKNIRFKDKKQKDQFDKDLKAILDYSYKNGFLFNSKDKKSARSYGLKGGEASDVNLEIIRALMDRVPIAKKMGYATRMFDAKDSQTRRMEELEESGISVITALYNESIKNIEEAKEEAAAAPGKKGGVLHSIYDEVRQIREILSNGRPIQSKGSPTSTASGIWTPSSSKTSTPSSTTSSRFYSYSEDNAIDYDDLKKDNAYKALTDRIEKNQVNAKLKDQKMTLTDRILESKNLSDGVKAIYQNLNTLVNKPTELLTGVLKKADLQIYRLIFGDEELKNKREEEIAEKGIGGYIISSLKNQFNQFGEWFKKDVMLPIADMIDNGIIKKAYEKIAKFFGFEPGNLGKKIRSKLFGAKDSEGNRVSDGLIGGWWRRFTGEFKSAGRYTKDSIKSAADYAELTKKLNEQGGQKAKENSIITDILTSVGSKKEKDDGIGETSDIPNAAAGMRRVTKTGIIAASEGEMIIPSSLNPYDIKNNLKKENKAKEKFINSYGVDLSPENYAEGGKVSFNKYIQNALDSKDPSKIRLLATILSKDKDGKKRGKFTNILSKQKDEDVKLYAREGIKAAYKKLTKDDYEEGRDKNIIEKSVSELANGIRHVANYIRGLVPKDDKQAQSEKEEMVGSAWGELKKFAPEAAAGGVMGAGVSLITGMVGGPLLGVAVGASISLAKNSKKFREVLFGKEIVNEEGNTERQGGLFSKKISNAITKYAPAMGKGAVTGAITSILPFIPGGPLTGILVGGSIGFVSQNEKVREKLFGEDTKLGKIADNVKKALPKMGAGAIAGMVVGPFGLVTNLLVGSAIGFATSTDKFKRFMFGYDDEEGNHHKGVVETAIDTLFSPIKKFAVETGKDLKGWAEKYILQPLKDSADPIKKQFELMFKDISDSVSGALNKLFEDKFGAPFDKFLKDKIFSPVSKFVKGFVSGALSPIKAIVSAPFKMIGAVGNHYRKKQIQSGDADYMTANERLQFMNNQGTGIIGAIRDRFGIKTKKDRFSDYDKAIVDLQNQKGGSDTLRGIYDALNEVQNQDEAFSSITNPAYKQFNEAVRKNPNIGYKDTKKIGAQLRKMVAGSKDPDDAAIKVNKYVAGLDMDPELKKTIIDAASEYIATYKQFKSSEETRNKYKKSIYKELSKQLGVKINEEDAPKLLKYLEKELPTETEKQDEDEAPVSEGTIKDTHEETITHITKIENLLEKLVDISSGGLDDDAIAETMKGYEGDFNRRNDAATSRRNFFNWIKNNLNEAIETAKYIDSVRTAAMEEGNVGLGRKIFGEKSIDFHNADQYNPDGSKKTTEARDAYEKIKKGIDPRINKDGVGEVENAASGMRRVSKTGVVAVSEGEMIVPKSLNPFAVIKNTINENVAKSRFLGKYGIKGFATGSDGLDEDDIQTDGITVDGMRSAIQNTASGVKKKVEKAYYTFVNGKPLRFVADAFGKLTMDRADADTKRNYKDIKEDEEQKESIFSKLSSFAGGIFGKKKKTGTDGEEEDNGEEGNTIFKFLSKVTGLKDTAAKVAKVAGLTIGLPIMVGVWNDHIWPKLEPMLSPVVEGIKNVGANIWEKIQNAFSTETGFQIKGTKTRGISSVMEFFMNKWASGMEVIFTKVIPKTVELFISVLPTALVNLGKGIVNGLKMAISDIISIGRPNTSSEAYVKDFDVISKSATGDISMESSGAGDSNIASSVSSIFGGTTWSTGKVSTNGLTLSGTSTSGGTQVSDTVIMNTAPASSGSAGTAQTAVSNTTEIKNGSNVYNYNPTTTYTLSTGETLTADELLKYKGSLGIQVQDPETGEVIDVTGDTLLDYPEAAAMFGFESRKLTSAEKAANEKAMGIPTGPTVGSELAGTVTSAFLRGSTKPGDMISKVGRGMKKIPFMKTAGRLVNILGKGVSKIGKAGQSVLPSWMTDKPNSWYATTDKAAKEASEKTAKEASEKAAKSSTGILSKIKSSLSGADDIVEVYNGAIPETMKRSEALAKGFTEEAGDFVTSKQSTLGKVGSTVSNAAKKLNESANNSLIGKIINKVKTQLSSFLKTDNVVSYIMTAGREMGEATSKEAAQKTAKELASKLTEKFIKVLGVKLAKAGVKVTANIAATVTTAGLWKIVDAVTGFVHGWRNTNDILGVANDVNEASGITKLVCGLASALNEVFAFGLVPLELLVTLVIEICQKIPGLANLVQGISEDREESAQLVAQFNEKYGLDLEVEDYNTLRESSKKNDSILRDNPLYKFLMGTKSEIDDEGNYVKGEQGAIGNAWDNIKETAGNVKNYIFGNKETGEKNIFGKGLDKTKEIIGGIKNSSFGKAISSGISSIGNAIGTAKDTVADVGTFVSDATNSIVQWLIHPSQDYKPPKLDEKDPLYTVKNNIHGVMKNVAYPLGLVIRLAYQLWDKGLKPIGTGLLNIGKNAAGTAKNMMTKAWSGDVVGAFMDSSEYSNTGDSTGVAGVISQVVNGVIKVPLSVPALLASGLGFIVRNFKGFVDGVAKVGTGIGGTASNMLSMAWKGDFLGAFTDSSENAESDNDLVNKISSVANNVIKVPLAIPTLLSYGIGGVVRDVKALIFGIKEVGTGLGGTIGNMLSMAWKGNIQGAFADSSDNADSGNELVDKISSIANNAIKVPLAIPTLISFGLGKAVSGIKSVIDTIKKITELSSSDEKLIEDAQSGDISIFSSKYWTNNVTEDGFVGTLQTVLTYFQKIINIPMALVGMITKPFKKIADKVGDFFGGVKDTIGNIGEWFDDNVMGNIGGSGSGLLKKLNARVSGLSSSETNKEKENGTFISQLDPKYANQKFNVSGDSEVQTLADTGCGPASAAMVINSFRGDQSKMNLKTAATDAINYKVEDQGVSADYFGDTFRKHGLNTKYIMDSDPNTRAENIAASLYSDNKVVLMGQDFNNKSKGNSPFGPNPHYVVATGISPDGKYVYINDPESNKANVAYPSASVLRSTTMGIAANAASGSGLVPKYRKIIRKYNARGKYGSDTIQYQVWQGLRGAGYNETASAAAMGNIEHESGFDPDLVEKGSGVGFGLVQWSYGRRTAYENYAKSKGKSPGDLQTQIEYLLKELQADSGVWTKGSTKYGFGTLTRDDWANGNDLDTATKAFMCCFERPSYSSSVNHIDRRLASAREYYEAFTGTPVTGGTSSSGDSSSGGNTINTVLDTLNVFDQLAEAYGLTSSDSSSSSGTSSSSSGGVSGGNDKQKALVEKMKSIQGTLTYSQASRNPDNGSGDCSSTVQWAYKNVLGIDPGSNSRAQKVDEDTYTVTTSFDESKMQPGDLILYNGHVEMYAGNGQMIGHGGPGKGPTMKPLDDQGRFEMVRRWVGFKNGSGSGLTNKYLNKKQLKDIRNINWVENNSNTIEYKKPSMFTENKFDKKASTYTAGASGMTGSYKAPGNANASSDNVDVTGVIQTMQSNGDYRSDSVIQGMVAIIKLLYKVVDNTSTLQTMVTILSEIVSIMSEEGKLSSSDADMQKAQLLQSRKENLLTALKSNASGGSEDSSLKQLVANVERLAMA